MIIRKICISPAARKRTFFGARPSARGFQPLKGRRCLKTGRNPSHIVIRIILRRLLEVWTTQLASYLEKRGFYFLPVTCGISMHYNGTQLNYATIDRTSSSSWYWTLVPPSVPPSGAMQLLFSSHADISKVCMNPAFIFFSVLPRTPTASTSFNSMGNCASLPPFVGSGAYFPRRPLDL